MGPTPGLYDHPFKSYELKYATKFYKFTKKWCFYVFCHLNDGETDQCYWKNTYMCVKTIDESNGTKRNFL